MATITRFTRTNGRDLSQVRRPAPARPVKVAKVAAEPAPTPVEEMGDSPKKPAANDAKVKPKKSDG